MPRLPKVFHPRYPWKIHFSFGACLILAAIGLLIALVDPEERLIGLACMIFGGLIGGGGWLLLPRKIVFDDAIVVERQLSIKRIAYTDITDLGVGRLKARWGGISWMHMDNGEELQEIINRLIEDGVINPNRLEGKAYSHDAAAYIAFAIAGVVLPAIGLFLWVGVIPSGWLALYPDWVLQVVFPLGTTFVIYLIVRSVSWRERRV